MQDYSKSFLLYGFTKEHPFLDFVIATLDYFSGIKHMEKHLPYKLSREEKFNLYKFYFLRVTIYILIFKLAEKYFLALPLSLYTLLKLPNFMKNFCLFFYSTIIDKVVQELLY